MKHRISFLTAMMTGLALTAGCGYKAKQTAKTEAAPAETAKVETAEAETAEPGTEEVAANVARIEKFYKAYMNPEGRTNTQRLTKGIFTPRMLEKIHRVGESGGYDPIIEAQDTNEHGVRTMKCRHLGGDWYEVSYWWDEQKQVVKSLKVVGQGEDMRIDDLITGTDASTLGEEFTDWVYYYDLMPDQHHGDVIIALRRTADRPEGYFWGTSDEFVTAREGYYQGFTVLPLLNLTFAEEGKEASFTLHFEENSFFSNYIDVDIHSADEARKAGYHTWLQDPRAMDKNDVAFHCRMAGDSMVVTTDLYYPEEPEWNRRTFRRMSLNEIRAINRKLEPQYEKANRREVQDSAHVYKEFIALFDTLRSAEIDNSTFVSQPLRPIDKKRFERFLPSELGDEIEQKYGCWLAGYVLPKEEYNLVFMALEYESGGASAHNRNIMVSYGYDGRIVSQEALGKEGQKYIFRAKGDAAVPSLTVESGTLIDPAQFDKPGDLDFKMVKTEYSFSEVGHIRKTAVGEPYKETAAPRFPVREEQEPKASMLGKWFNMAEELRHTHFSLDLKQDGDSCRVSFCATALGGNRVEADPYNDQAVIPMSEIKGKKEVTFSCDFPYSGITGKVQIRQLNPDSIEWKILELPEKDCFVPKLDTLTRQ